MQRYIVKIPVYILLICSLAFRVSGQESKKDSIRYPVSPKKSGGLVLKSGISYQPIYDPVYDVYLLYPKSGELYVADPVYLTPDQYANLVMQQGIKQFYQKNTRAQDDFQRKLDKEKEEEKKRNKESKEKTEEVVEEDDRGLLPSITIGGGWFESIFGGSEISFKPQGFLSFDMGIFYQKLDNPQILPQNRTSFAFDIQQRIQFSILGSIGEKFSTAINFDTQRTFNFDNQINLAWEGEEDNIVQKLEFGNVSMPLSTSLITGSQALFGAKSEFKFGNTYITTVFSEQQSEAKQVTVQGNGLVTDYKVSALNYDYNQHYFIDDYFRNEYDTALANYPLINSDITINRIQVWRIDQGNASVETRRQIMALRDLGEGSPQPKNGLLYTNTAALAGIRQGNTANTAMENSGFTDSGSNPYRKGEHYLLHENVRELNTTEYTFHPQLGYVSLQRPLDDNELIAVAYQYTVNGKAESNKVGEFSNEEDGVIIVKLIKPNVLVDTNSSMWDLMMKNIYSIGGSQITQQDFSLNVMFQDANSGSTALNYIPNPLLEGIPLLQITGLDRLNIQGDIQQNSLGQGDGLFDFQTGITINPTKGKIIFTQKEPFGENLDQYLVGKGLTAAEIDKLVFDELYSDLPSLAQESAQNNRYFLQGKYKGEVTEGIPLGAINVPKGSVKVTANGQELLEGQDYTVDYQLGRVKMLNQSLVDSGVPINVSLENRSAFNIQKKRMLGVNIEHRFSDKFLLGGTFINYNERLLTQKAQFGQEPVNNSVLGLNTNFSADSRFLTRLADNLPLVRTNAPSKINVTAEAAYLIPGLNNAVNNESYIDDFDEIQSRISIDNPLDWTIAATPKNSPSQFPNGSAPTGDLSYNYNRSLLSWYNIDPIFFGVGGDGVSDIGPNQLSLHKTRRVQLREIYPGRINNTGNNQFINTFDISIYPEDKGPYNFNPAVENPQDRWAGITRPINVTNFENANVEYLEFWMMDPYLDGDGSSGEITFQIGNVSEDILNDNNLQYENGLPEDNNSTADVSISNWGKQPDNIPILYAFSNEGAARRQQDVGYDGLINSNEPSVFPLAQAVGNQITGPGDVAGDDFVYYLDNRFQSTPESGSLVGRYKYFRNSEGNTPSGSFEASSVTPDVEDANLDNNLDLVENYLEYRFPINSTGSQFNSGQNYIVNKREVDVTFTNGTTDKAVWYQYRIPVSEFKDPSTNIHDPSKLNSVRYMRMLMDGFNEQTTLRFASMDLVRSEWRVYNKEVAVGIEDDPDVGTEGNQLLILPKAEIGVVNIEENGDRNPPYVVPPGIVRQQVNGTTGFQGLNEQSLALTVRDLNNDATAVFKNVNLDLRRYKQLKMFLHAQDLVNVASDSYDKDARFFIRFGNDLSNNYYEYEIGLKYTATGTSRTDDIWPDENNIVLDTEQLVQAKQNRDAASISPNERYVENLSISDPNFVKNIIVKGRPTLGNITNVMMGIRNTGSLNKSVELWMNELRFSDIENDGGYAARANVAFNLADFATVQASGDIKTVGFGALDQGPSLREQSNTTNYNINTTTNLDKFLPENWGLSLPLTVSYGESVISPEFNPLDNDVKLNDDVSRNEIEPIVEDRTVRRTISMTNIRKTKNGGEPRIYDPENISLSFVYSDNTQTDLYTERKLQQNLQASANYNFTFKESTITPFEKLEKAQDTEPESAYLVWLRSFNFNWKPTNYTMSVELVRNYNEQKYRDINSLLLGNTASSVNIPATFSNNFKMNWRYNLNYNFSESLTANLTSTTETLVEGFEAKADDKLIFDDLFRAGRPVNYNQQLQANYKLPLDLFPYFFWITADLGYTAGYTWRARSSAFTDNTSGDLGNLASNNQSWNFNGSLDFETVFSSFTLYNNINKLYNNRRTELKSLEELAEKQFEKKKKKGKKRSFKSTKFKSKLGLKTQLVSTLFMFRQLQFDYTQNRGVELPGLIGSPNLFGTSNQGPNAGFVFGLQKDLRERAINNGWIDPISTLIEPYMQTFGNTFNASMLMQPSPSFRIDITFNRTFNESLRQAGYNIVNTTLGSEFLGYQDSFENITSSFNISFAPVSTSFKNGEEVYKQLIQNSKVISQRIGGTPLPGDEYADGYGISHPDVLLPSFLSAVNGSSSAGAKIGFLRDIPLPNWSIQYDGLYNIPYIRKRFNRFTLSHKYSSTYTVGGIQSNQQLFDANLTADPKDDRDNNGNFHAKNVYGSVNVVESFSPLIGSEFTLRNKMQFKFHYNKDRLLNLSLANFTLIEDYVDEFVIGFGYTIEQVAFAMKYQGKKMKFMGDVNLTADLSMRSNKTVLRSIITNNTQVTGGQNIFSLKLNAGYNFTENFVLSAFYDQQMTSYEISTAFPLTTVRAGLNATFTLQ